MWNNRIIRTRVLLILIMMAIAPHAAAYEEDGWGIAILNDRNEPYLRYLTPNYTDGSDELISWRMIVQHDRTGRRAAGVIAIEIRSKLPLPQTVLAASLVDGNPLVIDRVRSASEPCIRGDSCEILQKVFLNITDEQILAANREALKIRITSDRPFEIEFPAKIMERLSQLLGEGI